MPSPRKFSAQALVISIVALNSQASAAAAQFLAETPAADPPKWPIYCMLGVGLCIAGYRMIAYFRESRMKVCYFPEPPARRRLTAPYSGGNRATVSFASSRDA